MITYCKEAGLIINSEKTQLLVSTREEFRVSVGSSFIKATDEICLLGVDYDLNFTTLPYLQKLAQDAKTRSSLIYRLSFSMPNHLLKMFTNGLLMGKILASAPATLPIRTAEDQPTCTVVENINKAIKATARTITKTKLTDRIHSNVVLERAGLRSLNEIVASSMAMMVWKSKNTMDPLGQRLFPVKNASRITRSLTSTNATQPVPGYSTLATNLMARAWNSVPGLSNATTQGSAKRVIQKWAKTLPK